MIQEIANVAYQTAVIHGRLLAGKKTDVAVDHLADVDPEIANKWIDLVTKIANQELTTTQDVLEYVYGNSHGDVFDRQVYVLYDTILSMVLNLSEAGDIGCNHDWRNDLI